MNSISYTETAPNALARADGDGREASRARPEGGTILKFIRSSTAVCLLLLLLLAPATADAQTRGRRTSTQRRPAPRAARGSTDSLVLGRMKVAEKIKVISAFLYVYGGIANGVELTEAQARDAGASRDVASLSNSKAALRRGLQDVRAGLDQLELEFRTSPDLQRHYDRLAGVAAAAADAEELAASSQLKAAGRKLLVVVNQLTDALAAMN